MNERKEIDMRPLLSALLAVCVLGALPLAQPANAGGKKPAAASHKGHYECPKCHMESAKAGKCPHCKVALVPESAHAHYECKACKVTSEKAGKCAKCGKAMTKVAAAHKDHKGHKH